MVNILLESGWLGSEVFTEYCSSWGAPLVFLTDSNVRALYGEVLVARLRAEGIPTHLFSFPAGERYKTRTTKEYLENQMLEADLHKKSVVVGLGGGVTLDLAGFIASTYYRGIPLVFVPTTLLAMADACIGGKNGVNTAQGKNILGTFYPPHGVLIDAATLCTLPVHEFRQGMVEIIKHAILFDQEGVEFLHRSVEAIQAKEEGPLLEAIQRSIDWKRSAIEKDPFDEGYRRVLNYGHTLGHALEVATDYSFSHSDAVAWGMVWEAEIARRSGKMSEEDVETITSLLQRYSLLQPLPSYSRSRFFEALKYDKKRLTHATQIITLQGIGAIKDEGDLLLNEVEHFHIQEIIESELPTPILV